MSIGPSLIFDKSSLQMISADESMWLECFYITNTTPLFFVETLADLEKETKNGKTQEEVVGIIASKTPDISVVNVHYKTLIASELLGHNKVEMSGRPIPSGMQFVELAGKTGSILNESKEMQAAKRWSKGQFLDIERDIAKEWRQELTVIGQEKYPDPDKFFSVVGKPNNLQELKKIVDMVAGQEIDEKFLDCSMSLMGIVPQAKENVINRWKQLGVKSLKEFAPYFAYVLSIDLFFYFGTSAKLFESFRHASTHKVDIAYLYYLPFCNIFTSNDKIHEALAPIFMRQDQTFVKGVDLKNDLAKLNAYYDKLPDDIKTRGTYVFAPCPPDDQSFLATRLWDKFMSKQWRSIKDHVRKFDGTDKVDPKATNETIDNIKMMMRERNVLKASETPLGDTDCMIVKQMVSAKRGKWNKFPKEVLDSKPIFDSRNDTV